MGWKIGSIPAAHAAGKKLRDAREARYRDVVAGEAPTLFVAPRPRTGPPAIAAARFSPLADFRASRGSP